MTLRTTVGPAIRLTAAAVSAPLLLLFLAGCGSVARLLRRCRHRRPRPWPTSSPTPSAAPPVPGSDERFRQLLAARGVPYTGVNPDADASVVCATFAADPSATRDQVAALQSYPELQQRRWYVDTAVEVYCPELG